MNILVTGGFGFIGNNVIGKLLGKKHSITVIDSAAGFSGKLETIKADIRDHQLSRKIEGDFDTLIHLAAKSDARNMQDFVLFKEINVDGTLNMLELARKNDIGKVIFTSSSHVYGSKKEKNFKETSELNIVSHYGATKFFGEAVCRAYSEFQGIKCDALRLFTVYGPGGRNDMAVMKFIQSISKGERIDVHGKGEIKKDFVYIDDVSNAIVKCLGIKRKFEIINIGSGKATSLSQLVLLIEKKLGRKAKIRYSPMQPGDTPYSCADISKARKLLKWEPKVPIEEGIKKTVEWWKDKQLQGTA